MGSGAPDLKGLCQKQEFGRTLRERRENVITSNSNPKVRQIIQWQNKAGERRSANIFLIEGFKMFEEAPEQKIRQVFVSSDASERIGADPVLRERLERIGYEEVAGDVFARMSDTRTPQGILCVVERPQYSLEQLLQTEDPLLVVLEDLQDPGNLGTIIRTGEGAGITGVIMSGHTVDLFNPKTIRATMGSVFRVPFVYVEDLLHTIQRLDQKGIHTYAACLQESMYYDCYSYKEGTAFLIGNEGKGLTQEIAAQARHHLKIPMEGEVESLNAAVAAALLVYEAHRQRKGR